MAGKSGMKEKGGVWKEFQHQRRSGGHQEKGFFYFFLCKYQQSVVRDKSKSSGLRGAFLLGKTFHVEFSRHIFSVLRVAKLVLLGEMS